MSKLKERVQDIYSSAFNTTQEVNNSELDALMYLGSEETLYGGKEHHLVINEEKTFIPKNIIYSLLSRENIIQFISSMDKKDFINYCEDERITPSNMLFVDPVISTIIKNMKFNFDFKFYIGELNKHIINNQGIVNNIPKYYPKLYRDSKDNLVIDNCPLLKELLSAKNIQYEIVEGVDHRDDFMYTQIRDEDIPKEIYGIYNVRESDFERLILNEASKDIKSIRATSESIKEILSMSEETLSIYKLQMQREFIDEFIHVLDSCIDEYGTLEDPITFFKTRSNYIDIVTLKNLIEYTKDTLIKKGKMKLTILNETMFIIEHITIDDINRKKRMFISDYYLITDDENDMSNINNNVYVINGKSNLVVKAFSEKYDYLYIPMGGIIHKIKTIRDNATSVIIKYKDNNGEMKRVLIHENGLNSHNIYTTYGKALEDGGQKDSIEERSFILKIEEMKRKYEQMALSKITSERKSKMELITKILKIVETENDQSTIIKMLEIEKATLANQNASMKNTKEGYEFIKTVARDAMRFV